MALEAAVMPLEGLPRLGPVLSPTNKIQGAYRASGDIGLDLYPWQRHSLKTILATDPDTGKWQFREVAIAVARQNGKTKLLIPLILDGLSKGERILHTAQNRILPRVAFREVAKHLPDAVSIRHANGQEEIQSREGGSYKIVAPQRGARGESADKLIIDELREMEDFDFIAAAEPTLTASDNPQVIYLSNAGTELSVVLNDLKNRSETDHELAYLEWSAAPERAVDDEQGWLEANPSVGYSNLTLERLRSLYEKYRLAGELAIFETEHLCRWVVSMAPRLVADAVWQQARAPVTKPLRPAMGISVDPSGKRASAALAWLQSDGSIGLMVTADVTGDPIDLTRLAVDLMPQAKAAGVQVVAFDPWTDQHLSRHFPNAKAVTGQEFANASERFVRAIETGGLHWQWADAISADLPYASRKSTTGTAWIAERARQDRSISAVLAAIRAVWLASAPRQGVPSVY